MKRVWVVMSLGSMMACSKSGGASKYTHDEPHFTVQKPSDLKVGKDQPEGDGANLSIRNDAGDRELFFVWAPKGSAQDPFGQVPRLLSEKILEQGEPSPGTKQILLDRGGRTFIYKIITTGNLKWGVMCMASTNDAKRDADLIAGCKSLEVN